MLQADDYKMKQIVIDAARCNSRTTATRSSSSSVAAAAVACRLSVYLWLAKRDLWGRTTCLDGLQ